MNAKLAGLLAVLALACGAFALGGAGAQPVPAPAPGPAPAPAPPQYQFHHDPQGNLLLFDPASGRVWAAGQGEWHEAVKPVGKR